MDLSVIIVSYNVKYFLEQCLCSVHKALDKIDAEIIVVDNNSTDGSLAYLQHKFPLVQFIANKENVGFGKANNVGLGIAKGQYILFLNPDTIVPEDCFTKCLGFFKTNNQCGALGIKMIDGSGHFLPESKRAFPSVPTSFFKLVGLSSLFPKSKIFNRYALGFLHEDQNHQVDVLCGAFMMISKEAADRTNGFDEDFFMYGEDIDLSYRIQKMGFKNYYFSESCIIHFKGESSIQQGFKHNKMFYEAMGIFVKKHYGSSKATLFSLLLQLAIALRGSIGLLGKFFALASKNNYPKQLDGFVFFGGSNEVKQVCDLFKMEVFETIIVNEFPLQQLQFLQNKNIIFCEGSQLKNIVIIQIILQLKQKNNYWFHAKNSDAIVGSYTKSSAGQTITMGNNK